MNFSLRPMRPEDIPQVAEIEREAFPTNWPPTSFKRELGNKLARYLVVYAQWGKQEADSTPQSEGSPSLETPRPLIRRLVESVQGLFSPPPEVVYQGQDFIAGYVGVWFMMDEAHITSIAVRETYWRLGLGELLMMGAVELSMARRAQQVTLEARISNFPAHALYEKYGFKNTGTRKGYYSDNHEDAVIMTTDSILSPAYQELFQKRVDAFLHRRGEVIRTLV